MSTSYDRIGLGYAGLRRPDERIARQIADALTGAERVLNVGAGTGNYEPTGAFAVEPSLAMISQRSDRGRTVQAVAERLPVRDGAFDATLCTFTLHHWTDLAAGLAELRRVAQRQVVVLCEPMASVATGLWLIDDYVPEAALSANEVAAPTAAIVARHLDVVSVEPVLVPADCTDGFTFAYWNRPEQYLDPTVRAGMSSLAQLPEPVVDRAMDRLAADLASGAWDERHGHLRDEPSYDAGYRLVIAST